MSLSFLRRMVCTNDIATPFEFEREVAFSREPHQPKQYVQNLVTRDAARIYDTWIKWVTENITYIYSQPLNIIGRRGGYVYICGKIAMAEGVETALKDVLRHIGNMDTETVDATLRDMRTNKRYQEDIFG